MTSRIASCFIIFSLFNIFFLSPILAMNAPIQVYEPKNFETIPREILLKINTFLEFPDLNSLSLVSQKLHETLIPIIFCRFLPESFTNWPASSLPKNDVRIKLRHVNEIIKRIESFSENERDIIKSKFIGESSQNLQKLKEDALTSRFSPFFYLAGYKNKLDDLYDFTDDSIRRSWSQVIKDVSISLLTDKTLVFMTLTGIAAFWIYYPIQFFPALYQKLYLENEAMLANLTEPICPDYCTVYCSYEPSLHLVNENMRPAFDDWAIQVIENAASACAPNSTNITDIMSDVISSAIDAWTPTSYCSAHGDYRTHLYASVDSWVSIRGYYFNAYFSLKIINCTAAQLTNVTPQIIGWSFGGGFLMLVLLSYMLVI